MRSKVLVAGIIILSSQLATPAQACVSWGVVKKKVKAAWAKGYPREKVLSIKRDGRPGRYTKRLRVGRRLVLREFCSVPAKVAVKRANGSQAAFSTSWHYYKKGSRWVYDHHSTGTVQEKMKPGEAPPKAKIKQMVAAAWVRDVVKTDKVSKVLMTPLKKLNSKWKIFRTLVDLHITDNEGKRIVCKDYRVTVYKGKKVDGTSTQYGTGDGPWDAEFTTRYKLDRKCKPQ